MREEGVDGKNCQNGNSKWYGFYTYIYNRNGQTTKTNGFLAVGMV